MPKAKPRILFVCVENANRSQMAEAFAKIHGADKVESFSAGSHPSGVIHPKAIEAMKEAGYDLTTHKSKSFNALTETHFDVVVTMGCGDACPFIPSKAHLEWDIPDPKNLSPEELRKVRDLIESKVTGLLKSLKIIPSRPKTSA